MSLPFYLGSTPAEAACVASGATQDCTGDLSSGIGFTAPGTTTINVNALIADIAPASGTRGVGLTSQAGNGGNGSNGGVGFGADSGETGGHGAALTINYIQPSADLLLPGSGAIITVNALGIYATSSGGRGGRGGHMYVGGNAGDGGNGGRGGDIIISFDGAVSTSGSESAGVVAVSAGGNGGNGGNTDVSLGGSPGDGGEGGRGGLVTVDIDGTIITGGSESNAVHAVSRGGAGGSSGNCSALFCGSSGGGNAARGETVTVTVSGGSAIETFGAFSNGIYAASIGGFAGSGGSAAGVVSFGSSGASAGAGGQVFVDNAGGIATHGDNAYGIFAQSVGGGGGGGGSSGGLVALGGSGSRGGAGGAVEVINTGVIATGGDRSVGIVAQSIGGSGGDGGSSGGLLSIGGNGAGTSPGGAVSVTNSGTVVTQGSAAQAIFAQSIGGGGGNGGSSVGLSSIGGEGGGGGDGGTVQVVQSGVLRTTGADSTALLAQSIGGGGGNGGNAFAGGFGGSLAIGGSGGDGGHGGAVTINPVADVSTLTSVTITTLGDQSHGIQAQSVGGGGGNGGLAISGTLGGIFGASIALGGAGGDGGSGGAVTVNEKGIIATGGDQSIGIFAQSVGGGGGNGGGSVAATVGSTYSLGFSLGGSGGSGGHADAVTVNVIGRIETAGVQSHGIFAQSVGGGGGNGGFSIAATGGGAISGALALGGSGGTGGSGSSVTVGVSGDGGDSLISTEGDGAIGIFAQSVGGGGGNGGFAGSLAIGAGAVSVGLGGSGGSGGVGGAVDVTNANSIVTQGENASGILAQSVGGGGGNGGSSLSASGGTISIATAIGGAGGAGSDGSGARVNNSGDIVTLGSLSYGVMAQSVGGGGGNGGFALSGALGVAVDNIPGGAAAISIGGTGGGASNGGAVTIDNAGSIETFGLGSHAIFAQSVGGGGGSGGFAGSVAMTIGSGASFGAAVGGFGGGGGDGGVVDVSSLGDLIITHSDGAHGILAQSIGGGGGDGGFAFSGAFGFGGEKNVNATLAIGGFGGDGGIGNDVGVSSSSSIVTHGTQSYGVFAQSIGGGGGNGGFAVSGTLGLSETAGNVGVTIGGFAGDGGAAGSIVVDNSGAIMTFGSDAIGILAQSIGGSGGNGGMAMTAQMTGTTKTNATIGVAIGGGGGDGNSAGTVEVSNSIGGSIVTSGFAGHAIKAQSIGGGGGNGGLALVAQVGMAQGTEEQATKTLNVGVAVGGGGGNGGFGNDVDVINHGSISVLGDTAMGIFAQSIGGGGGDAGGAINALGMLTDTTNNDSRNVNVNVTVGGSGGTGNHGGAVAVENTGNITTRGVSGYGIYAQSVGGGGGIGGRANTLAMVLADKCTLPAVCSKPESTKNNLALGITLGGNGGGAGNGDTVEVVNRGVIVTFGDSSDGIHAQSVGGGGGNAGNGILGSQEILPISPEMLFVRHSAQSFTKNLQIQVGGDAGASGNGGIVTIDNNQGVTTHGAVSHGIFAQSVGGGGGVGGNAVSGATGTLGIGGKGGAGGDGGAVTVSQNGDAFIQTFGAASYGIFAQSVGGGGGIAGNVVRAMSSATKTPIPGITVPALNAGVGLSLGQGGGAGGDGGAVTVSADDLIVTHGDNAAGIFAQSVGGGGGVLGEVGSELPVLDLLSWMIGSNGDAGDAGNVDVTVSGTIATAGNNAAGIIAQSAGGQGMAGDVTITLAQSILAGAVLSSQDGTADQPVRGLGSIGIFAQSAAADDADNGDVTINIANRDSVVRGGRSMMLDATRGYTGVGIWVQDGRNNSIVNHGLVTTLGGVDSGYAILATGSDSSHLGGNEAVSNFGTVTGSFDLGVGANSFTNQVGGVLNSGRFAYVGAGNLLTNHGVVSPGGLGRAFTTAITGNMLQTATGAYAVDVDFATQSSDRLDVTGSVGMAGAIVINPVSSGHAQTGSHRSTIVTSAGGVTDTGTVLKAPASAVASYALDHVGPHQVDVTYSINFNPGGLPASLGSIGQAVNQIQSSQAFLDFAPIAAAIFAAPDLPALVNVYNAIGGGGTVAAQHVGFAASSQFLSALHDQAGLWFNDSTNGGADALAYQADAYQAKPRTGVRHRAEEAFAQFRPGTWNDPDRWRAWASGFGNRRSVDANRGANQPGLSQSTVGGIIGIDRRFGPDVLAGLALSGTAASYSVAERATEGTMEGTQVAMYGMVKQGPYYLSGSLGFGLFDNRTKRMILAGAPKQAKGRFQSHQMTARIEFGRRIDMGAIAATPFAAIEVARIWQSRYTETSTTMAGMPGGFGLAYYRQAILSVPLSLGVHFATEFEAGGGMVISPFARLAWVHEFSPDRSVAASFNAAPGIGFVTDGTRAASDLLRVNLGGRLQVSTSEALFASFNGEYGTGTRS